jgi:hypothetical protein
MPRLSRSLEIEAARGVYMQVRDGEGANFLSTAWKKYRGKNRNY